MKKLITYKNIAWTTVVGQTMFMSHALAAAPSDAAGVSAIIDKIAGWLFTILISLAAVIFIYAAFLYMTAGGNAARVESAKKTLIWGIVGFILATLAWGIPEIIKDVICGGDCTVF